MQGILNNEDRQCLSPAAFRSFFVYFHLQVSYLFEVRLQSSSSQPTNRLPSTIIHQWFFGWAGPFNRNGFTELNIVEYNPSFIPHHISSMFLATQTTQILLNSSQDSPMWIISSLVSVTNTGGRITTFIQAKCFAFFRSSISRKHLLWFISLSFCHFVSLSDKKLNIPPQEINRKCWRTKYWTKIITYFRFDNVSFELDLTTIGL